MIETLDIFVIHASFLGVRKPMIESMVDRLRQNNPKKRKINVTYITECDPSEIQIDIARSMVDLAKPSTITNTPPDVFDLLVKNIHLKQLSNALKHFEALKRISVLPEQNMALVIEDDVLFGEDVDKRVFSLGDEYTAAKDQWDVMFLGTPQPMGVQTDRKWRSVFDVYKVVPCIESYFIHPKAAKKLVDAYLPVKFVTNVHMSYVLTHRIPDFKTMMSLTNIFIDGTKLGVYLTTLDPNSRLFLNNDYNNIQSLMNKESLNVQESKEIQSLLANARFKTHPDMITFNAMLEIRQKNYAKAKELFDQAFELYQSNECILNNDSEFLVNYARVFKHLQEDVRS